MDTFAERFGFKKPRALLQLDDMDDPLRVAVWNWLYLSFFREISHSGEDWRSSGRADPVLLAWARAFKLPLDELPDWGDNVSDAFKKRVIEGSFFVVYQLIECLLRSDLHDEEERRRLIAHLNYTLEVEQSGYRFVGGQFVSIVSPEELAAYSTAVGQSGEFKPVADHLSQSAALLSDRQSPDYRNSVKEAISAVEAACRIVANRPTATLADALRDLEARGLSIPVTLRTAFDKLYAWTSSADGIRHALVEDDRLTAAEARFMLIACSAFSNYLIDRSRALTAPRQ